MQNKIERRSCQGIELRQEGDVGETFLEGYAAVFNSPSLDMGGFTEVVKPGAFDATLADGPDVRALVDHDRSRIVGRTKPGTLRLSIDPKGLRVSITLPGTTVARDLATSVLRGDLDSMSFAFTAVDDAWLTVDGKARRELYQVDLVDVSVVSCPAYPDTSVAVRAMEGWRSKSQTGYVPMPNRLSARRRLAGLCLTS